ncbi:MAG TPA: PEP-CTERM sorting domain-containing protein [Acidobacteriaceae bacterium]|nr:PEP-CTERM sorting domain-containing protein [Acidobacteriaceae bacterium]
MKRHILIAASILALLTPAIFAHADTFGTYGDTTVVNGPTNTPVYQLTSNPALQGYAGIYVEFSGPVTLASLTQLSAQFEMTAGTISGGAPRFSIGDTTNNASNEAYIYFGTSAGGGSFSDPAPGTYENTGNDASLLSTQINVQNNGFGGGSTGASYETFSQFVAQEGTVDIGFITVDVDGGFTSTQTADIGNFDINGTLYNPPATSGAAPEPGSLVLLGTGILGLATATRRRLFQARS